MAIEVKLAGRPGEPGQTERLLLTADQDYWQSKNHAFCSAMTICGKVESHNENGCLNNW